VTPTDLRLDRYRRLYAAGSRSALHDAVALCAREGVPLPAWAAEQVLRIHAAVVRGQAVSLDTEYGLSTMTDPRRRHRRYVIATRAAAVGNAILAATRAGVSIDDRLLQRVADDEGLTLRQVRDCWRACRRFAQSIGLDLKIDDAVQFTGVIPPQ
jgi:hypothetical protein